MRDVARESLISCNPSNPAAAMEAEILRGGLEKYLTEVKEKALQRKGVFEQVLPPPARTQS